MNKALDKAKHSIIKQKKMYLILILLVIIGLIAGGIFTTVLSQIDQNLVKDQLTNFFEQIKTSNVNYTSGIINSMTSNLLYCIGIWLLGISIIGLPVIVFLLFMKGFITGFSIGSIVSIYHWKGIVGAITYIFPHHIISLLLSILLSFYAISFSSKIFSSLFLKKEINFKEAMHRYIKIFIICLIGFLICSILEIYLSPFLIKLFTHMI